MRKLAVASFSFSAAIFAAVFFLNRSSALYAAVLFAFLAAAVLGIRLKILRGLVITFFAAAVGFLSFAAHYDLTVEKAHVLSGMEGSVRFTVMQTPKIYDTYTSAEVRLEQEGTPRLKCILYDTEGRLDNFSGGDIIAAGVKLSAGDIRYGAHTDRYTAKDVYLTGTVKTAVLRIGHKNTIITLASRLADAIDHAADSVFPQDTAGFIKALITGNKTDLYRNDALYVALSRSGFMHVVAVSGLHVSFLVAILQFVFGKGRRNSAFCILLVWAFVIMTGLSPSAIRAAFMQSMLLSAPLFGRESDPLTSLSAALAFLLLLNPFAAANISLQLSFAAMLGLVLFSEKLENLMMTPFGEGKVETLMKTPVGVISSSLSVMVFTLPLTAIHFGYVSVLSPVTNLLCLWTVPICFAGGYISCLLSFVPTMGKIAAVAVSYLVRYCFTICRYIASFPLSAIYLSGAVSMIWIAAFYIALAAVFIFRMKPGWKLVVPLCTALISILLTQYGMSWYYASTRGTLAAIDVGQGQCIGAFSGDTTVLVDCGSTSYAEYNAGDCAAAYLRSRGRDHVDLLVFTHLHEDHANGFERLTNLMSVDTVLIPSAALEGDDFTFELLRCANEHGIKVQIISDKKLIMEDGMNLLLLETGSTGDENERCMPVLITIGSYDMIVTGDAPAAREETLVKEIDLSRVDALVVGHHGSKSASSEAYLAAIGGRSAIISVGKNNYRLPSGEVLERLKSFGYTVYRTDTDGDVEIRIHGEG